MKYIVSFRYRDTSYHRNGKGDGTENERKTKGHKERTKQENFEEKYVGSVKFVLLKFIFLS